MCFYVCCAFVLVCVRRISAGLDIAGILQYNKVVAGLQMFVYDFEWCTRIIHTSLHSHPITHTRAHNVVSVF